MATMTPTEFAAEVNSDGRTVRKFLRAVTPKEEHPGKGSRWALPGTKRDIQKLKKQFNEWQESQAKPEPAVEEPEVDETELSVDDEDMLDE